MLLECDKRLKLVSSNTGITENTKIATCKLENSDVCFSLVKSETIVKAIHFLNVRKSKDKIL